MIRTVVAFENESNRNMICDMLAKSGVTVRYICRTGAEAIRSIKKMGGGVVICGYKLIDMTADQLIFELKDMATFLVVSKPINLEMCESEDAFKLAAPVRSGELIGSVNMLIQLDQRKSRLTIVKRNDEEKNIINQAKMLIMQKSDMSEEQAYRYIQKRSMESSAKMAEIAKIILETQE